MTHPIDQLAPDIKAAARTVAYKWPTITTEEDMAQELALHFLERDGSLQKLLSMEVGERRASLVRVGHQIAAAERDDFEVFSGQYRYSVEDVKRALAKGVLQGKSTFDVQAGDIVDAVEQLREKTPQYLNALVSRYVHGIIPDRKGKGKDTLNHAVEALTLLMNRGVLTEEYEYENGGRHRSSRDGLSQADLDYDGEDRFDE